MTRRSTLKGFLIGCIFAAAVPALAATFNLFSPATGVLKGNASTYVTTAAASSDIRAMWTGTCNSTTFLRADGTCVAAGGGSVANPTALVGLTAVNGAASSAIRSDGAPALDQAITPVWTGAHSFIAQVTTREVRPGSSGAYDIGGNGARYQNLYVGGIWEETGYQFMGFTGNTMLLAPGGWSEMRFGSTGVNPPFNFLGTGGMFLNGVSVSAVTKGTTFTASGCSVSTLVGGDTAGSFVSGTSGTCTVVITLPASTNGWVCGAQDMTTPALFQQTANSTTSCTVAATTVSADVVVFTARGY